MASRPHLPHPDAEGPLPGAGLLQVEVRVEEHQADVALQVLHAPQLQPPRLPLRSGCSRLEDGTGWASEREGSIPPRTLHASPPTHTPPTHYHTPPTWSQTHRHTSHSHTRHTHQHPTVIHIYTLTHTPRSHPTCTWSHTPPTQSQTHTHTHTPPPPYTLLPSAPGQGWEAEIQKARPRTSPLPRLQEWPTGRTGTQKSENISHLGAGGDQPSFPEPSFPEPPPAFPRERRGSREIKASFPEGVGFSWAKRAWADWNGDSDTR